MKKLQIKTFITILSILTLSLLLFIVIFNVQNYNREVRIVRDNLRHMNDKPNAIFMDTNIYTIELDNERIKRIRNNSNRNVSNSEIKKLANSILNKNKKENIGILYFNRYSYSIHNNVLVISDNIMNQNRLRYNFISSLVLFILLEIIIVIISRIITNWIIKPVEISFKKQKDFIADASHELKTPLSVIISSSEALEDNPKEKKWLKNIKNEADRMNILINDLLELSKSENVVPVLSQGNLSKIIELQVLTFEAKIYENNLILNDNIEDNIYINLNENSLKQLVEILLDNAIKHSKKNGKIDINLYRKRDIFLEVINEGEGIPALEEERIFERFYRVDKSRNRKDNRYGLGLAIAKNIVDNHNGSISAKSENGKTMFRVVFKRK